MLTCCRRYADYCKAIGLWLALSVSLCVGQVMAFDLYVAEVPLAAGASEADLKLAKSHAMALMVVRLTGQRASLEQAKIKTALKEVDKYISHISRQTDATTKTVMLQLRFDRQAVKHLLSAQDLSVWEADRPSILAWLVIERQGIQDIISEGSLPLGVQLQSEAEQRGLPLLLPLMDLTDQLIIGPSDVWGDFANTISKASQRYKSDGLLWGRLYKNTGDSWQGQGSIHLLGEQQNWLFTAGSPDALMALIMENLGAQLSQRFALPKHTDQQHTATLHIDGIADLSAYAELRKILQALTGVTDVTLHSLQGEKLMVLVSYQGHRDNLLPSLERQSRLRLLDGQSETLYSSDQSLLAYYQWH